MDLLARLQAVCVGEQALRYTYDEEADAVFLYLVEHIDFGEVRRSAAVDLDLRGASIIVVVREDGTPLGIEFLGASRFFTAEALDAIGRGRAPFPGNDD